MGLLLASTGCFRECPFPMRHGDVICLESSSTAVSTDAPPTPSTRQWLAHAEPQLRRLLPTRRPVMLTDQMVTADGRPVDVYAAFDRKIEKMQGLLDNFWALQHTAQSIELGYAIEIVPPLWPGFQDVWIPVDTGVQLHGFLGLAEKDGKPIEADCIVVLPGLFGDNGAVRSRDVSIALRDSGLHVLSLEPRAHGQVEAKYPNVYYTYGLTETQDLMDVSDWLEDTYPKIRRTGLVGFCWGANQALLAAWYDGRKADDPSISPALARLLPPPAKRVHYAAGVIAFSPVLRWEKFLDRMDTPQNIHTDLSPAMFQDSNRDHMIRKGYPEITGSLRAAIAYDYAWSGLTRHFPLRDCYRFIRLMDYRGQSAGDKLEHARVPTLIVHAINDPLQTAQEVVHLIAATSNPKVAAMVLPGGGHIGFQAYARRYFYSLIVDFFDPKTGAATTEDR
jgi:predicted alpha/beta-fold hydrolase